MGGSGIDTRTSRCVRARTIYEGIAHPEGSGHIPLVLLSDVSPQLSHTSRSSGSTHGRDYSADRPRPLYFVLVEKPISGSLAPCFDYDDLTSDFGPIAHHTRLNSVEPKGFQFRHAMRAIVS